MTDAVAVWHGYRFGVPVISLGAEGFARLTTFQEKSLSLEAFITKNIKGIGGEESARGSIPIFERFFQIQ